MWTGLGASATRTMVGPAVAPHGNRHRVAQRHRQFFNAWRGQAHRVVLLQADQAQLQGQGAEAVAAAFLLHQPQLDEAHQVGMGLGRRHACLARQVFQGHRPAVRRQRHQQLATHLDALDTAWAALAARVRIFCFAHGPGGYQTHWTGGQENSL